MLFKFENTSEFITLDNRQDRPGLPINAETLNHRHTFLLPPEVVKDTNVLDLGCALGASGEWCKNNGVYFYTGVEEQKDYSDIAKRLNISTNINIFQSDIEYFLEKDPMKRDITLLLGVLYGVYNPLSILKKVSEITSKYICIETRGSNDKNMIPSEEHSMVVANKKESKIGFGWNISTQSLDIIMNHLGFTPDTKHQFITTGRYMVRYKRLHQGTPEAHISMKIKEWK